MKTYIKKSLNLLLSFFGYIIKKKSLSDYEVIYKLIGHSTVKFIDIGANKGQSIDNALKYLNIKLIHSYEPLFNDYLNLKIKNYEKIEGLKIYIHYEAVGCIGKVNLHLNQKSQLNSIKQFSNDYQYKYSGADLGTIQVDCVKLDQVIGKMELSDATVNILKIDTQGNEFNVLSSSSFLAMGIIDFIIIELITIEKYIGIEDFSLSISAITDYGFKLIQLSSFIEPILKGVFQTTELNLLFVHKNTIKRLDLPILI